jgi:hypothetical protein
MHFSTALCCVPLIAACTTMHTTYTPTNPAPRPLVPRAAEGVVMYTLGVPTQPYAEVGRVSASGIMWTRSSPSPFAALRHVAARRGCDGVIVIGPHDRVAVSSTEQQLGAGDTSVTSQVRITRGATLAHHDGVRITYTGTCIVYL